MPCKNAMALDKNEPEKKMSEFIKSSRACVEVWVEVWVEFVEFFWLHFQSWRSVH